MEADRDAEVARQHAERLRTVLGDALKQSATTAEEAAIEAQDENPNHEVPGA